LESFSIALPPCRAQEDLVKSQAFLGSELLGMRFQIFGELVLARLHGCHVLSEKFHLLPHAAANNDIVSIQARGPAFAVEHLVANVVVNEALQFLRSRRTPPRAGEAVREGGDAPDRDDNLGRRHRLILPVEHAKEAEQRRPQYEELQQWLPQQMQLQGVYQIGDV
jgi:hypothetical protein